MSRHTYSTAIEPSSQGPYKNVKTLHILEFNFFGRARSDVLEFQLIS